ncbi:hypothetical protein D3C71_1725820 [compost metagenome]
MTSKAGGLNSDRCKRCLRLIVPYEVHQIMRNRHELAALIFQSFSQCRRFGNRVQPWIKTNRQALAVFREPAGRRIGDKAFIRKNVAVGLIAYLQLVTAVDENIGLLFHDQCSASRARKACEPAQALGAGRYIFALMFIGARNEKAIKALLGQLRA